MHSLGNLASQFTAHFLLDTFNFCCTLSTVNFGTKDREAEKGEGHVEELKLHIIHELLELCKKHRATEYAVDKIFAQNEIDVLRLPTKHIIML